jgi:hypothetical protein
LKEYAGKSRLIGRFGFDYESVDFLRLGQFRYPSVQRYIHDLSSEMGNHFDELTSSLSMFIEVGEFIFQYPQSRRLTVNK